jgi:ubiquinone/menaquinone biosynthesis C-methylase UbiE
MDLDELQKNWNGFAKEDPLWGILTDPSKKGGKWDEAEFFNSGKRGVLSLVRHAQTLKADMPMGSALDFGCGVGRFTQALCDHYEECHGVDISPTMIDMAGTKNKYGERCRYHLNVINDLTLFDDNVFDFVLSRLVLQHMEPRYSSVYIREFIRVLVQGGVAVFQIPGELSPAYLKEHPIRSAGDRYAKIGKWIKRVKTVLWKGNPILGPFVPKMEMYGIKEADVLALIEKSGARILEVVPDQSAGKDWISFTYFVTK